MDLVLTVTPNNSPKFFLKTKLLNVQFNLFLVLCLWSVLHMHIWNQFVKREAIKYFPFNWIDLCNFLYIDWRDNSFAPLQFMLLAGRGGCVGWGGGFGEFLRWWLSYLLINLTNNHIFPITDTPGEKFQWIPPHYIKSISFKSKVSVVFQAPQPHILIGLNEITLFSQYISLRINVRIQWTKHRNWNVNQVFVFIISYDTA